MPLKRVLKRIVDCEHKTAPKVDHSKCMVVRTSAVKDGKLNLNGAYFTTEEAYDKWTKRCVPQAGDIIFTREAPAGEACIIPPNIKVCLGQRTVLFQVKKEYNLDYLIGMIYYGPPRYSIKMVSKGSTVGHFNVQDIGSLLIFKPDANEQAIIINYIQHSTRSQDQAIGRCELEISLIQEYRDRLIADVVTGKVDVRGIEVLEDVEELHEDNGDSTDDEIDEAAMAENEE